MPKLGPRVTATVCETRDGFNPLSDSARLVLDHARKGEVQAHQDGLAILDDHDNTILVAVSPGVRGKGFGTSLVAEVVAARPGHSIWAFHTLPAAHAAAVKLGLRPARELLQMGHSLTGIVPVPAPTGYRILLFEPSDAEGVVEANQAAFAHHPERGRLAIDDFQALTRQSQFNAIGLLAAYHDNEVVGFYWTKRHDTNLGEVYVLAIRPGHGGAGLGRALLTARLTYLHTVSCEDIELYVEASEERVVVLYAATGFRTLTVDTAYRREDMPRLGGRTDSSRSTDTRIGNWSDWTLTTGCWIWPGTRNASPCRST